MANDNLILLQPSDLISTSRETINTDFLLLDGLINRFYLANSTLIGPPGITFQGTYDALHTYILGDGVLFGSSSYVSLQIDNTGNQPDISPLFWQLVAEGGIPGATGPSGSTGTPGTNGSIGATGATGPIGAIGATGTSGIPGIIWRGNWSSIVTYNVGDVVERNGSAYIATGISLNLDPAFNPTFWNVLAMKGDTGVTGDVGASGTPGTVGATGPQGTSLVYRGLWNNTTTYDLLNMVNFGGQAYVAITGSNTGLQPDLFPSNWNQITITVVGSTGATGASGTPGGATGPSGATGSTGPIGATGPGGGGGGGGSFVTASSLGAVLDCDLNTGTKIGGGTATDNTAILQAYINTASQATPAHLIMDGPSLITGLQIPAAGYVIIEGEGLDTGFYLKSGSGNGIFSNRPGSIPGSRGVFVQMRNFSLNVNGPGNGLVYGIYLSNLDHVLFSDLRIFNAVWFNTTIENCGDVNFENLSIQGTNTVHQDGIHIFGPANDISISNCRFIALGDDAIAINAPEGYGGTISRVTVTNCIFYSTLTMARIYSVIATNYTVDNVVFSNCTGNIINSIGVANGVGFRIGNGGVGATQDWIRHLSINNCRVIGLAFMEFSDNAGDISVSNCTYTCNDGSVPAFYFVANSIVAHLNIDNFTLYRDASGFSTPYLVSTSYGTGGAVPGIINLLNLRNYQIVNAVGTSYAGVQTSMFNTTQGTINEIGLSNINKNYIGTVATNYANIGSIGGIGCSVFTLPDAPIKIGTVYLSLSNIPTIMTNVGPIRIIKGGRMYSGDIDPTPHSVTMVQHASISGSTTLAFPSDVTAGNTLVVVARNNSSLPNPTVVTDTRGNSWTQAAYGSGQNNNFPNQVSISYAIANSSGPNTVSVPGGPYLIVVEFNPGIHVLDFSAGTVQGLGGPPAPNLLLSQYGDLVITAATYDGGSFTDVGETTIDSAANVAASYKAVLSIGSFTSSLTGSSSNQGYASAAFTTSIAPGDDGDWYINTNTGVLWGPKTGGLYSKLEGFVPAGGANKYVLTKNSSNDYDYGWKVINTHSESLTDGHSNFIFSEGDIITVVYT